MKKSALLIAGATLALAPLFAAAYDNTGAPPPPPGYNNGGYSQPPQPGYNSGGYGQPAQGRNGRQPRNLDAIKARIKQRMSERQAELSKAIACVDAATTFQALRACRPHHSRGPRRGGPGMGGQNQGRYGAPGGQGGYGSAPSPNPDGYSQN